MTGKPGTGPGSKITAPRCLEPMKFYRLDRPRTDTEPVCWRPKGHAERDLALGKPVRHMSRAAYLRDLARSIGNNSRQRQRERERPAA